jgi:hypothetical protein
MLIAQIPAYDPHMAHCSICAFLMLEYECLKFLRSTASFAFISQRMGPSGTVCKTLRAAAEEARIDCQVAGLKLEEHRRSHSGAN